MADKTLKDVTDSLKAVDDTIKNQPKPTDISDSVKAVRDSVKAVDKTIKNQPKPKEPKDITDSVKGVEDSVKAIGETLKTPPPSSDITDSMKGISDSVRAVDDSIKNQPQPTDISESVKAIGEGLKSSDVTDSVKAIGETIKNQPQPTDISESVKAIGEGLKSEDVTNSVKGVEESVKAIGEALKTPSESEDVTNSVKGVEDSVKAIGETLRNPPKSAADVERAAEAAKSAEGERNIFQGIYDTLNKGFGAATGKDKKSGGLIAGLLGGIGAGLGGIGKAVASIGKGFGIGLAALGAGIAGFAIALGGASYILGLMGTDGSELTKVITNFFDAFSKENAVKMGVILVMAGLLAGFKVSPLRFAGMMTAMGAGIAGFAGGILIGEVVVGYGLKMMGGLDGGSIGKLISNFFAGFTPASAAGLGVVVTIAGLLAAFKVDAWAFAKQMTGVGAGIAGFAAGLLIGDAAAKLGAMAGLDGGSITALVNNFFGSMTPASVAGLGVVVTIAGLLAKFNVGATEFAKQMTGVGAGIAGFAAGLLLGDAAAKLGAMAGLDGGSITTLVNNFFGAMTPASVVGLGVVVTIAGLLTKFKVDAKAFAKQMTGVGAGIAGFAAGLLIGDAAAKLGAMAGLNGESITTLMTNFFGAMTPAVAVGLGVVVTIAGLLTKFSVKPKDFAVAMTGVGAGISGFAAGILIGDAAASYTGLDGSALAGLLQNFFGAMTPEVAAGLGTVVTLAAIGIKLGIKGIEGAKNVAIGMTGIGAGIAGFSLGILLGDGAAKLGAMAGLDGSSLKTLITNFMGAFEGVGMKPLAGLIMAGAAVGLIPGGVVAVIAGMAAIGGGIAAFMVGLLAADWIASLGGDSAGASLAVLLTNVGKAIGGFLGGFAGETMEQMKTIDADKLAKIGKGILDLGLGMVAFAGGRAAGGLADAVGGIGNAIGSLFGKKKEGPLSKFAEISKDTSIDANRLSELGTGISSLAAGLATFAKIDSTALTTNVAQLEKMSSMGDELDKALGGMAKQDGTTKMAEDMKTKGAEVTKTAEGVVKSEPEPAKGKVITQEQIEEANSGDFGGKLIHQKIGDAIASVFPPGSFRISEGVGKWIGKVSEKKEKGTAVSWFYTEEDREKLLTGEIPRFDTGGLVVGGGLMIAHKDELMLDNQAAQVFMKAAQLLTGSQVLEQSRSDGGAPIIVNNNNNVDNSQRSSQSTSVSVPESTRSNESTLRALQMS